MSKPLRTNPAYAHLAYQKAILQRTNSFLRRTFLGDELSEPKEILVCEEVFPVDAHVPQEEVQHFLERQSEELAELTRQLNKFQLTSPITQGPHEQKRQKDKGQQHSKGRSSNGKGQRTH